MGFIVRGLLKQKWRGNKKRDLARLAGQTPAAGVAVQQSIAYLPGSNPMHLLNLYRPREAAGLLPVVIDIHGGGWMYGDKDLNKNYCIDLASRGYAVMGMSYRLLPETDLKGQVQDIFASLHWLFQNSAAYQFDMSRVALTGDSAGGHLTGLVACIWQSPELQDLYGVQPAPFSFSALAISHGVCNVAALGFSKGKMNKYVDEEMHRLMFGKKPQASPLFAKASFEETAAGLVLPPVFLISSEPDRFYPQSVALRQYLQKTNAVFGALFWQRSQGEQLGHVFQVLHPEWAESVETNKAMLAFFEKYGV